MVSKFSLFMATAQYNFLRFIPGKKQQFFEYLEELSENVQTDFFCQDILEVWLENFGIGGLVLGSAALFSIGFILMIAADIIIWRTGSTVVTSLVRICSGLLQQVLPNGLKNKSLYLLGFEKGKMAVSDKKFLRIFKLCLLHRGRSFVRQF